MFFPAPFNLVGLSVLLAGSALSSATKSVEEYSEEILVSTVEKRYADPTVPCSIPANADPLESYPDFPECRDGRCPPCVARGSRGNSRARQKIKLRPSFSSANVSERLRQRPVRPQPDYQRPDYQQPVNQRPDYQRPDYQRPDNQRPDYQRPDYQRPDYQRPDYQRPDHQRPDYQRPDYQRPDYQRPDYQRPYYQRPATTTNCAQPPPQDQFESCPRPPVTPDVVQTFQCPPGPVNPPTYDAKQILDIIYKTGHCQVGGLQCDVSLQELLIRLTLLQEKLRRLQEAETKLAIYANMLKQLKDRAEDGSLGNPGHPGPPGPEGLQGSRGQRGPPGGCWDGENQNLAAGPPGQPGFPGVPGPPGDKVCGCDGDAGDSGFPGYSYGEQVGPKGPKGSKGVRGRSYSPSSTRDGNEGR